MHAYELHTLSRIESSRCLKVLIDCVPLTVGGGVQVAIALLLGLQRQTAVEWSAIISNALRPALPKDLADDTRITYVNRRSQADRLWLAPYLLRLERRFAPDIVFTVFGPAFFRPKAPHLVGFAKPGLLYDRDAAMPRGTLFEWLGHRVLSVFLRQADHIVVETEAARERLSSRVHIPQQRISVIPNGPNPLLWPLSDTPPSLSDRFVILVPSAYYWHKNLEIVPHVAAAIRRRTPDFDVVFRFTLPEKGADWLRIKSEAERLGVGALVETLGVVKITALAQAYHEASAVYLPTLREVSTAVYPESFLFRRPLVTTNLDFARALCGDGAIFADPRDPEDAAARFVELAVSPELVARMVEAGTHQLATAYPIAEAKLRQQLELIEKVAAAGQASAAPFPVVAQAASRGWRGAAAIHYHGNLAQDWDEKYAIGRFRKRAQFFDVEILPHLLQRKGHWLDAGCGSGFFSRLLAGHGSTVVGVDASRHMIEAARSAIEPSPIRDSVSYEVIESVENLDFPDESFDGVLCLSVVEYLSHPEKCLKELHRVLRPGGMLVISLPHRLAPIRLTQRAVFSSIGRIVPRKWEYATLSRYAATERSLRSTLQAQGFMPIKVAGFDSAMPQALLKVVPPSLLFAIARKEVEVDGEHFAAKDAARP